MSLDDLHHLISALAKKIPSLTLLYFASFLYLTAFLFIPVIISVALLLFFVYRWVCMLISVYKICKEISKNT